MWIVNNNNVQIDMWFYIDKTYHGTKSCCAIYGTFQCLKSNRFLIKSLSPLGTYILMKIYIKDNCVSQILITVVVHSIGEERVP